MAGSESDDVAQIEFDIGDISSQYDEEYDDGDIEVGEETPLF